MKQEISMARGTSLSEVVEIYTEDGELYEMDSGDKLIFGVKESPTQSSSYVIKKYIYSTDKSDDGYLLSLSPEDTVNLESKRYVYDIGLLDSSGNYNMVIECSTFNLQNAVTESDA